MAKGSETFRKRQREMKVREKAQLKRERRDQRRNEKKASPSVVPSESSSLEANPITTETAAAVDPEAKLVGERRS
jgi:hypothetical protein